jgi:hypothetical protein
MDCPLCIESFNKSSRKKIECKFCNYSACLTCIKRYLLDSTLEATCMNCKVSWDFEYIRTIMPKIFLDKEYKIHRENMLVSLEESLMPETQEYASHQKRMARDWDELLKMRDLIRELKVDYNTKYNQYYRKYNGGFKSNQEERRKFIMKCPDVHCRGFLSTHYKCAQCEKNFCKDCHALKNDGHECLEDDRKTVQLLTTNTKQCPKCSIPIFKIEGCFAKNTPIPMWDGSTKMSQDIQVEDMLIGDDGTPRIVQRIMNGEDEMYKIQQKNGEDYIVNSKHTLVLKYPEDKKIYWYDSMNCYIIKWFCRNDKKIKSKKFSVSKYKNTEEALISVEKFKDSMKFEPEIEMTVDDYIKLDKRNQSQLFGFKSSNGIHYKHQSVDLDPYVLGLWLGDGTHTHPIIASNDTEIKEYLVRWSKTIDAEVVDDSENKHNNYKLRIRRRGYTLGRKCINDQDEKFPESNKLTNPFMDILKKYNLVRNKHIPKEYLMNDRETRLKVLAGIVDTDGHVSENGKRIRIGQVNKVLAEQIVFVARSLGFCVNTRIEKRIGIKCPNVEKKDYKDQYCINISGDLVDIPTILPRKKCKSWNPNKDWFITHITVESIGKDNYYGWKVNNNHRFISTSFTVLKNCNQMFCSECHTPFDWTTGRIINGVIHNPHYFEWQRQQNAEHVDGDCRDINNIPHIRLFRFLSMTQQERITRLIQTLHHTQEVVIPSLNYNDTISRFDRNRDIRIDYLNNNITRDHFKWMVQKRDKANQKKRLMVMLWQMFIMSYTDLLTNLRVNQQYATFDAQHKELLKYINNEIIRISKLYSSTKTVRTLNNNWQYV